jgi:hypothetical protein
VVGEGVADGAGALAVAGAFIATEHRELNSRDVETSRERLRRTSGSNWGKDVYRLAQVQELPAGKEIKIAADAAAEEVA